MRRFSVAAIVVLALMRSACAWNADGHQIAGVVTDALLTVNAKQQIVAILGVNVSTAAPWLDCVKSVHRFGDCMFHHVVEDRFEAPCKVFRTAHNVMQQYVKRKFAQCSYTTRRKDDDGVSHDEEMGCDNTYHFADVAIQRDRFDRNFQRTNDHDIRDGSQEGRCVVRAG